MPEGDTAEAGGVGGQEGDVAAGEFVDLGGCGRGKPVCGDDTFLKLDYCGSGIAEGTPGKAPADGYAP
ncbi:hypothetical protein GCM10010394_28940 [Streptomyces crystallinus]|uniref:Uncharacterized protein n=1 Tax=Streptomyces crystallinus TaxID=68191 RepID=A0ABP3QU91_9ACTN